MLARDGIVLYSDNSELLQYVYTSMISTNLHGDNSERKSLVSQSSCEGSYKAVSSNQREDEQSGSKTYVRVYPWYKYVVTWAV